MWVVLQTHICDRVVEYRVEALRSQQAIVAKDCDHWTPKEEFGGTSEERREEQPTMFLACIFVWTQSPGQEMGMRG